MFGKYKFIRMNFQIMSKIPPTKKVKDKAAYLDTSCLKRVGKEPLDQILCCIRMVVSEKITQNVYLKTKTVKDLFRNGE